MNTTDPPPTQRGLAPGRRVLERFVLQQLLGRGGMGEVWLALDERLGGEVALKFVADLVRWDPASLELLKQETNRSRQLSHPHIVRIHDLIEDANHAAITMEYLSGGSVHLLRARRQPPVLSPVEIGKWLPGVCAAVDFAHAQKIIHRDLKPGNLLISADGAVKVADFGIAQPMLEGTSRVSHWQPSGTVAYMSPQQHFGDQPNPRDDIYALGATLYELLTSKPPFYAGNLAAQIERRRPDGLAERRRQLGLHGEPVPKHWEETIAACLAKRPEDRPATAAEIAQQLTAPPPKSVRSYVTNYMTHRLWRLRVGRLVLLGLLVLGLGLAIWKFRPALPSASTASASVHPSDALRAYAAWNLDGDGRDASGRGLDLRLSRSVPTVDRHGRIDRALYFNGNTALESARIPVDRWGGSKPFTVALWINPASLGHASVTIMTLRSDQQDDLYWSMALSHEGRINFMLGQMEVDNPDEVASETKISTRQWTQVSVSSDGQILRLFLNGQEAGRKALGRYGKAMFTRPSQLRLGHAHKFDSARFVGALDEVRLWQRTLSNDEITRLASGETPPRFVLTHGTYPDKEDLPDVVRNEFGSTAALADWEDLVRWHADDTLAFCESLELEVTSPSFFIQRSGQRISEPPRHYFVNRFGGKRPDYYKVYEELGGMTLALGSWHGSTLRALVRLPMAQPRRETLRSGPDKVVEHDFAAEGNAHAIGLNWSQAVPRVRQGGAAELWLRLNDGRELHAVCAPAEDGMFALALGDALRPQITRKLPAVYDTLVFTLVVEPERLTFRAVTRLGAEPVFQERVQIEGLKVSAAASMRLAGVEEVELVIEP